MRNRKSIEMIHKCYFKLCSYLKERFHPWKQTVLGGFDSNSHLVWWKKEKHFHSHFQQKQFISPLLLPWKQTGKDSLWSRLHRKRKLPSTRGAQT